VPNEKTPPAAGREIGMAEISYRAEGDADKKLNEADERQSAPGT
jgi:hypothetical protein